MICADWHRILRLIYVLMICVVAACGRTTVLPPTATAPATAVPQPTAAVHHAAQDFQVAEQA